MKATFWAVLDTLGWGREWHIKEWTGKRENSSRASRGCGFDCGLNHKEREKYEDFGSVVGTAWCSVTLTLWRLLMGLKRDRDMSLLYFSSCILCS